MIEGSNICQIYVRKNGGSVLDIRRSGFKTGDAVNVMSVTKGIMGILLGIAIDKGFIISEDQKVLEFFDGYVVKRGEKTIGDVTIRHLITMTAPYKFRSEPWTKVCTSSDWTLAALDLLGGRSGITGKFKYTTLGIQILAGIIENASGMKCIDFANRYLFEPLEIPGHKIHGTSSKEDQFDYLMTKKPRINEWYSDPQGTVTAGWGLCLSARDMSSIGQLIIDEGMFEGRRIVSSEWLSKMTAPYLQLDKTFGDMQYGYMWYRPHKDRDIFAAIGDGGNVIYADPVKRMSVGVTGTFKPRIFDRVNFIEDIVIPMTAEM